MAPPPAQEQQLARQPLRPPSHPWLQAGGKKNAGVTSASSSDGSPGVLAQHKATGERERFKSKLYRTKCKCHVRERSLRVFRLRGRPLRTCCAALQRTPPSEASRPAFRAVEHRCRPPAQSWARRWASACSCTATPCASCRCCAVRARVRNQRAANGAFAPTLSAPAFVRCRPLGARHRRGPRRHGWLVRGCLGGAQ